MEVDEEGVKTGDRCSRLYYLVKLFRPSNPYSSLRTCCFRCPGLAKPKPKRQRFEYAGAQSTQVGDHWGIPGVCRVVLITGGSRGMGLEVARQLAGRNAYIVIVARDAKRLEEALVCIKEKAVGRRFQRFHAINADLTDPNAAQRVMREVVEWNGGKPPDVVWCCAGSAHPTLFADTPAEEFKAQMESNYLSAAYIAQAALQTWLRIPTPPSPSNPKARHIILTGSTVSFYSIAGYSPYSPSKAALRSLADSISREVHLYAGANPKEPEIKVHTVFAASILTDSYERENLIKADVTKKLEEADKSQTAEAVARKSIVGLERGYEFVATDFLTKLVMTANMGGSSGRGGFWRGLGLWVVGCVMSLLLLVVRGGQDRVVRNWGRVHGASGFKKGSGRNAG
ncbi:hypothetical protein QBC35DRAFT_534398 [Podospora australis]|uniref:3-dehydrosphinganine reductase n=1 Tax=Podospora australis TaxID=1536484 RepID=A0AAN6WN87_9PEZI|nr:hypothetical protein QBC35DRAFT_534398 [Podospora australis]